MAEEAGWAPGSTGQVAPPLIEVRALSKHFQLGAQLVRALDDVDVTVRRGEFLLIMGASGSGKSTLLNLVGGLDRPTEGSIMVAGNDIATLDELALAAYRRRRVGFVFQSFNLIPTMSARQNVEFPMVFAGIAAPERRRRAETLLTRVGLGERMSHRPNELSGGEQQRVAIARAMANDPTIVLGDEPTGNLDTSTGEGILRLLTVLNDEGATLLVVTHDPRLMEFAHRVVHMQDGKVIGEEPGQRDGKEPAPRKAAGGSAQ